jgi:hypothetical protein
MPGGLRTARHCVFTGKAVTQTACADAGSLREHSRQHENMLLPLRFVAQATVNRRNTKNPLAKRLVFFVLHTPLPE